MDDVKITQAILVIAALVLVFILYKVNHAIRLLNNRVNIISHALKELRKEGAQDADLDATFLREDSALRARLDRHWP